MRMDGKTTRLIDKAVQMLFDFGEIMIISNRELFNPDDNWKRGLSANLLNSAEQLIDPDARKDNGAQQNFLERLQRRLEIEHAHYVKMNITSRGIVFNLKQKL